MTIQARSTYPVSISAERGILGIFIEDSGIFSAALGSGLNEDDFSVSDYKRVFNALVAMREKGWPIDSVSLLDYLGAGQTDAAMISELTWGAVVEIKHALHHVKILRRKARLRGLIRLSEWIREQATEPCADPALIAKLSLETWSKVPLDIQTGGGR